MHMGYILESLSSNERVEKIFKIHWAAWVLVAANFAFAYFVLAIWAMPAMLLMIRFISIEQGITNKRIVFKKGLISRDTQEVMLSTIESISIQQSIVGRILGYGAVEISGRGAGYFGLIWVSSPIKVKKLIEDVVEENQK